MATIVSGLLGGLLGSIVTGAVMMVMSDDPGPSAMVWAKYFGDGDPTNYATHGAVVHLIYGAVAGAAFVVLAGTLSPGLATLGVTLLWAIVWSAVLVVVAAGFWTALVLGHDPSTDALVPMAGEHLVFGVVLGLVVYYVPGL